MQTIVHLLTDQGLAPDSVIRWAWGIQVALVMIAILIGSRKFIHKVLPFLKTWWIVIVGNLAMLGAALVYHAPYTLLAYYAAWIILAWLFRFAILSIVGPRVRAFLAKQAEKELERNTR